jgi:hypothetical protein
VIVSGCTPTTYTGNISSSTAVSWQFAREHTCILELSVSRIRRTGTTTAHQLSGDGRHDCRSTQVLTPIVSRYPVSPDQPEFAESGVPAPLCHLQPSCHSPV